MKTLLLLSMMLIFFTSCKSELDAGFSNKPTANNSPAPTSSDIEQDLAGIFAFYMFDRSSECHPVSGNRFIYIVPIASERDLNFQIVLANSCGSLYYQNIVDLNFHLDRFSSAGDKIFNANLTLVSLYSHANGDPVIEAEHKALLEEINPIYGQLSNFINTSVYWKIKMDLSMNPSTVWSVEFPGIDKLFNPSTPISRIEASEVYESIPR